MIVGLKFAFKGLGSTRLLQEDLNLKSGVVPTRSSSGHSSLYLRTSELVGYRCNLSVSLTQVASPYFTGKRFWERRLRN